MSTLLAYGSRAYWKYGFSIKAALAAVLTSFGALWLLVEIVSFFSPQVAQEVKEIWWAFFILGVTIALWVNRPIHEVSCHLSGRDIELKIKVGNFFETRGAMVVGSNTTFDTDTSEGLIDKSSVQGQFTASYYSSLAHLDLDLDNALVGNSSIAAVEGKRGKQQVFPVGTVAKLIPKGRVAYFVAIAHVNTRGIARGSFDDLQVALPALWEYITEAGSIDALVIPVLGSGFSRLPQKREEIIREILKSFIAACAVSRFTESLTVVIHPKDFYKNAVDLSELGAYLQHVCRYSEYGRVGRVQGNSGTAVGG